MTPRVSVKRMRDRIGMNQIWRHKRTRKAIMITRIYRHSGLAMYIDYGVDGAKLHPIGFSSLDREYELMSGPERNLL